MDYEEYKEEENGEMTISNAKKMKDIQVDVLPCVYVKCFSNVANISKFTSIDECDGKEVKLNSWFNMYRREHTGYSTSMLRGRPLQGKTFKDANFYLMKEDKLNEDALKTAAKVNTFTNWIVQVRNQRRKCPESVTLKISSQLLMTG